MICNEDTMRDRDVVVLESHSSIRAYVSLQVQALPGLRVVGEAVDCMQAREILNDFPTAVIIADPLLKPCGVFSLLENMAPLNDGQLLVFSNDIPPAIVLDHALRARASIVSGSDSVAELRHAILAGREGQRHFSPFVREQFAVPSAFEPQVKLSNRLNTLTPRRMAVLMLKAWGYSVKEAARCLGVSVKSVDSHLNRLRGALGVRNRADLAMLCIQEGLINLGPVGFAAQCPQCGNRVELGIAQWMQAAQGQLESVCRCCAHVWNCNHGAIRPLDAAFGQFDCLGTSNELSDSQAESIPASRSARRAS